MQFIYKNVPKYTISKEFAARRICVQLAVFVKSFEVLQDINFVRQTKIFCIYGTEKKFDFSLSQYFLHPAE